MKHLITLAAALLFGSSLVFAQTDSGKKAKSKAGETEQEFIRLYKAWDEALVKVDLKFLDRITADDYILTGIDGSTYSKSQALADLKSGDDVISAAATDDFKINVIGDMAIVNSRWSAKEINKGKDISGQSRFTETWVKRAGHWQVVASQGTRIDPNEAEAKQELTKLQSEWDDAMVKTDMKACERILGDDYVGTDPEGHVFSKSDAIAGLKSGEEVITSAATDELKISVYGNTAVVTGRYTAKGKSKGKEWSGPYRFTNTWVKREGRWQVVADQWAKIATK